MTDISFPHLFEGVLRVSKNLPFTVFGVSVAWYGTIISIGILLAAIYAFTRCNQFGISRSTVLHYLFYGIPACYLGARLYYVIYMWDYYAENPVRIWDFKDGGMAIYGAVIAGALSVFLYFCLTKGDILRALDLGSLCILIGQVIGRWGNFINGEAFGYATNLPWGMSVNGAAPVHPTFLYESLWNLALLIMMHIRSKKPKFRGEVVLWYILGYGLGRSWIEGLRTDSLYLWNTSVRVSQLLAILSVVGAGGVLIYFYVTKRWPRPFVTEQKTTRKPNKKKT